MSSSRLQRGFTLIETLIALAIIAAIAALVLPATYAQLTAAKFDQATREVILAGDACRTYAIGHSTTCRLVISRSAAGVVLSMESVETPSTDGQAAASTLQAASIGSVDDDSIRTRSERLYLVPDGLMLGPAIESSAEESEVDAPATAPDEDGAAAGGPPDHSVLATFLPDGSVVGRPFELSGLNQRAKFSTLGGAGRLKFQRVAVEEPSGPEPSRSERAPQAASEPRGDATSAASSPPAEQKGAE